MMMATSMDMNDAKVVGDCYNSGIFKMPVFFISPSVHIFLGLWVLGNSFTFPALENRRKFIHMAML